MEDVPKFAKATVTNDLKFNAPDPGEN